MKLVYFFVIALVVFACKEDEKKVLLPYLGHHEIAYEKTSEHNVGDTIFYTIDDDFSFITQDSLPFTANNLKGKISIAKFFFTHCPTICPPMTGQMDKLQQSTADISNNVQFLSFSIDPKNDTVNRLRVYMDRHDITADNWFFLTGVEEEEVHRIGTKSFYINAMSDNNAEGGFAHSAHFILVDSERHIRGLYDVLEKDGKGAENLKQLEKDIRILVAEEFGKK